jgi:phosphoglycerate dehydrogenase-like enzyme
MTVAFEVFIVDSAHVPHGEDDTLEREVLGDVANLTLLRLDSEADLSDYAGRADGLILWHHIQLTAASIALLTKTRIIVRNGVGFDNVDIAAARRAGIAVANVPDYGTEEVADHAIALSLALVRQIKPLMREVSGGVWEWKTAGSCRRLSSQIFGVVGCGRIGTATAVRAKALGFQVRIYDPYLPAGYEKGIGVARATDLHDLLAEADIVSLHTPLNSETHHLLGSDELSKMKRSAYLVNTSRGGTVAHEALMKALSEGQIAGAGLDVLEDEPAGAVELSRFRNCIVTPHSAFYSQESLVEMRRKSAATVRDALVHARFRNVVN